MDRHTTSRPRKNGANSGRSLRAVVLLNVEHSSERPDRSKRQAAIGEIRDSASAALSEIDAILARFDGRRLSDAPTALGTIMVETSAEGMAALSKSQHVKAILQDQPITRVS
jgi:hypothetical protein